MIKQKSFTQEEQQALQHRLAMYQQLATVYPLEYKYLQKQAEVLILLGKDNAAEVLLLQLQHMLRTQGLTQKANEVQHIRQHLNQEKLSHQLYSTPFLHLASSSFLDKIFRSHRRLELEEGDYLVRYGEHETQMYILVKGELAVWSRDANQQKYFEHMMHAGEVIGELAFLDNTPRTADVIACSKATVLTIPSKAALRLFMENPKIEQALRQSATTRKIQMDLKKNAAFAKLPLDLQLLLAKQGHYIHFKPLERIYQQQQNIETIDLICHGSLRLLGEMPDGSSIIINSLKQGDLIGCSAAFPHMEHTYMTDIVSMENTTLIRFPAHCFLQMMAAHPLLHQAVLQHAELEQSSVLQTLAHTNITKST